MSAPWIAGVAAALLVAAFFAFRAVRRFSRNPGRRVNRLADPRPFPEEQERRTDPDPDLRYFRPAPPVWPPQITDRPPD